MHLVQMTVPDCSDLTRANQITCFIIEQLNIFKCSNHIILVQNIFYYEQSILALFVESIDRQTMTQIYLTILMGIYTPDFAHSEFK